MFHRAVSAPRTIPWYAPANFFISIITISSWFHPRLLGNSLTCGAKNGSFNHQEWSPRHGTCRWNWTVRSIPFIWSFCYEIKPNRLQHLKLKASHCHAIQADFLCLGRDTPPLSEFTQLKQGFDVIITSPSFSLAIKFIEQGLRFLKKDNLNTRLLYLLFVDFRCSWNYLLIWLWQVEKFRWHNRKFALVCCLKHK